MEPLSNLDTNGAEESAVVSEVSSFQRLKEWYILGLGKGVLFREVSSVQECPQRYTLLQATPTKSHTH